MQTSMAQVWQNVVLQWIYIQENIYALAEHFLNNINRKFRDMDKYITSLLRLRTITQEDKHADEHVQDLRKQQWVLTMMDIP